MGEDKLTRILDPDHNRWLLSAIVESSDDAIISKDMDGTITTWNRAAERIFGYAAAEALGKSITLLLPPDRIHEETDFLGRLRQGELIRNFETVRVRKDGNPVPVSLTISPVRDGMGRIIGASKIARDITERKKTEEALARSEQRVRATFDKTAVGIVEDDRELLVVRLRDAADQAERQRAQLEAVFQAMRDGVMILDTSGKAVLVNEAKARINGYASAENMKRDLADFAQDYEILYPDGRPVAMNQWPVTRVLRGESVAECELRVRRQDSGQEWFLSFSAEPVRDALGRQILAVVVTRDITERKQAEQALREARDELERTVQQRTARLQEMVAELETFSYSLAHDMRAPLRAMQGFADAVLEDYGDRVGPEGKDYLQRIKAAAARQDHFIRDVLSYSRLVRQEPRLEPVNLDQLVPGVIAEYPNLHAARECIEVHSPLGVVLGHGPSLVQCVSNLLGNALKFVAPGIAPRVKVWSEPQGGLLRLCVQDNGLGIAPEHQNRIFRLFERLHSHTEYPGTGIGLAVVRKAVERMGGTVGVESKPGQGSQFWLELKGGA